MQKLCEWVEENAHPDPGNAEVIVFDTNVNGWRSSYQHFCLQSHPDVPKILGYTSYLKLVKKHHPNPKKQKHSKDACDTYCSWKSFKETYDKWKSHISPQESTTNLERHR